MIIAVASGKGGTGKTTIAAALAHYAAGKGIEVDVYDCDVEEPNINIFLQAEIEQAADAGSMVPHVDNELCTGCGKCDDICEYSAIVMVKNKPLVFPDMCHSCGACTYVCPEKAVREVSKVIGVVESGSKKNINYTGGRLRIGEAMSPPLIKEVKRYIVKSKINIIDSPPGTSCPVIASIRDADYVVLVTEPTSFGLHDLMLAVDLVKEIDIPFGVVINKSDIGDSRVEDFCISNNIDIITSIPHSRDLAVEYSKGNFFEYITGFYEDELSAIAVKTKIIKGEC